MKITITNILRSYWVLVCLNLLISLPSLAQDPCNCPSEESCAPCDGGLTTLTLLYQGDEEVNIRIRDFWETYFQSSVSPGETFTFEGTEDDGTFIWSRVYVDVDGDYEFSISVNCNNSVYVNAVFDDDFVVIAGESRDGGALCCAEDDGDNTPPVISGCPDDISASINGSSCSIPVSWEAPTADDDCNVNSFTSTHNPGDNFSAGTTTVTYTATDDFGNISTCSFDVTVTDNTPPAINNCPNDIQISTSASACGRAVSWTAPQANDNCSLNSLTSSHSPGDFFSLGTTEVTYTATDDAGNETTCSFNVVVSDGQGPIFENCPENVTVGITGDNCSAVAEWTPPNASDNCGIASTSGSHSPGDEFNLGSTEVTYTATDNAGNIATCTFNIIVEDNEEPVFTNCPEDITINADENNCSAVVSWNDPDVSDNCNLANLSSSHSSGDQFPVGTTEITYTATDDAGNESTCSFTITVEDTNNPIFTSCPDDIVINLGENGCNATVNWEEPTATDECEVANITSSHSPGDEFQPGNTEVTYTATDNAGNTATCSFTVTIDDSNNSIFSHCPEDIQVALTGDNCSAIVEWDEPDISGNCNFNNLSSTHNSGDEFPKGITEVVYTATDSEGNAATCSFEVQVGDNAGSLFTSCPEDINIELTDSFCPQTVEWDLPEVDDNCTVVTLEGSHESGGEFSLGTTEVIYTATDTSGNSNTCSFDVNITTNYTSVFSECPENIVVISESGNPVSVDWTPPEIIIDCHSLNLSSNFEPGDEFGLGTTTVTYNAETHEGIVESCSFNISILDEENLPPEAEDLTVSAIPGEEIEICINASDPEDDPLVLEEIILGDASGTYFDQNEDDLCFTYQVADDFAGKESIEVRICEDTGLNQCTSAVITIESVEETNLQISQVITPDGDGINDLWIIENIENYENNKVAVFDRWGGLIYKGENYNNETVVWDGFNNGKEVPTGTYFYSIEIEETTSVKRGFIELIK